VTIQDVIMESDVGIPPATWTGRGLEVQIRLFITRFMFYA